MHKICCVVEGTINRLKNQELCFCNPRVDTGNKHQKEEEENWDPDTQYAKLMCAESILICHKKY